MSDTPRHVIVPGDRVDLCSIQREDVPLMTTWFSDLETTAYSGQPGAFYRLEDEQRWFDGLATRTDDVTLGIQVRTTGTLIGTVGLKQINHRRGTAELGITIGDKQSWNLGYGSEAVRLMAEYGCFFHNLVSICLWHVAFNERGHRAYIKAGFREAGRWRDSYTLGNERFDLILMDITPVELDLGRMRSLVSLLHQGA
ncbi:MAG: GNAT family protein [Herpetosiphon sp.]